MTGQAASMETGIIKPESKTNSAKCIQLEPYCKPGEQVPLEVYEQWYGTEVDVIGDASIVY